MKLPSDIQESHNNSIWDNNLIWKVIYHLSTANITDKNLKGRMSAFISYKKDKKSEEPFAIFEWG